MDILFVLQQRAVQRRNELLRIALAQNLGTDVLDHQELEPIEQFRSGRLLLHSWNVADFIEQRQCLRDQALLDSGKMDLDDGAHGICVWETDVVEEATAQKRVG